MINFHDGNYPRQQTESNTAPWNDFNNPGHQNNAGRNDGQQMNNFPPPWVLNQRQHDSCEDKNSDCSGKEMYCHGNHAAWMNTNCQRTCGKCLSGSPPPWEQPKNSCEDKHSDCSGKEMYCHGNNAAWMNVNCQRTCGKCLSRLPIDCKWSEWTKQGYCSKSCGDGSQVFTRTILVASQNGGQPCVGQMRKTEPCYLQNCPDVVDCQWSEWQSGSCSRTCGRGVQMNFRTERVQAQNGGSPCFGSGSKWEHCNLQDCPVLGK